MAHIREGRIDKITEGLSLGGFSLRMVLSASVQTDKSSDITPASADTTHGRHTPMV